MATSTITTTETTSPPQQQQQQPSYSSTFLPPLPASSPPPSITRIDFTSAEIPQYASAYAVIIDNLFTPAECSSLLSLAEQSNNNTWDRAQVNIGNGREAYLPQIRNCGRIIWDSVDMASRIWERVRPYMDEILEIDSPAERTGGLRPGSVKYAVGLNERLRFLKYGPGEFFERHCDGCYRREVSDGSGEGESSMFTLHLYLNAGSSRSGVDGEADGEGEAGTVGKAGEELVGGPTTFYSPWSYAGPEKEIRVQPKVGRVLIFQQAKLLHAGDEVIRGVKYTVRTDVMYRLRPLLQDVEEGQ